MIERQEQDTGQPNISLTFDDGPDPIWTPRVLEALRNADARATFFVVAPAARRSPHLISRMLREGHSVEFHCMDHVRHTERSPEELESDTREGLRHLMALGVHPRLWRPPWGIVAPWTESIARTYGLQIALWTIDPHDWRGDSAEEMFAFVEPRLADDATVLLHDGLGPGALRSGCEETVALIEPLANLARELGYTPTPLLPDQSGTRLIDREPIS